jgi:CHAT domain-containing protein/cytochrome c-type biogenesis protein CcmH/NrfG
MRPADAHLNPQEFELLLFGAVDSNPDEGAATEAQKHLGECSVCQSMAEKYRRAEEALKSLQDQYNSSRRENTEPGSSIGCPDDETWFRLAAGLIKKDELSHYIAHASTCDRCGALLRNAMEVMSEKVTSEEQELLASMVTPEWQHETARKMEKLHVKKIPAPAAIEGKQEVKKVFWGFAWRPNFTWAGLALIIVAAASWFTWLKAKGPDAGELVSREYTQHRTVELRIEGAQYGPPRVERGAGKMRPLLRVEAEALIRRKLEKQPQDPRLLQLFSQVELLDWNYLQAIDNLKHALELSTDSSSIRIDLASAYFERAENTGNTRDYGTAIELLGQVLQKDPDNPIALFNRAILAEKTFAYRQAVEDWEHYLHLRPNDEWSQEARQRLDELKKKITEHDHKATEPLLNATGFSLALEKEQQTGSHLIDSRLEEYQQKALEEWFPAVFSRNAAISRDQKETHAALEALAGQMAVEHNDHWFSDMLKQRVTPNFRQGMEFLQEAILLSNADQARQAETAAQRAINRFELNRSFPGVARARAAKIYAFQMQLKYRECLDDSRQLIRSLTAHHYSWLETQVWLEQAICSNGKEDFNLSESRARTALDLARRHYFSTLEQRVLGTDAFNLYDRGLEQQSLEETTEGLRRYWQTAAPPIRGYQFYWNLFSAAESKAEWHLAVVFGTEAVSEIALTGFKKSEASSRSRLALVAAKAGAVALARTEADHAERIIFQQVKNPADPYLMDLKIARAEVELKTGNASGAMDLLKQVKPDLKEMTHYAIRLRYYATLGSSALKRNLLDEAGDALNEAVRIGDDAAVGLNSDPDRLAWELATGFTYRSAVELRMVHGDYAGALDLWERYRLIAAGRRSFQVSPRAAAGVPAGSVGIVWALLPDGLATWVQTPGKLYTVWTVMDQDSLQAKAREFAELCANPATRLAEISSKGRGIYKTLFTPIRSHLPEGDLLVVESDGLLAGLPFPVLENEAGVPLVAVYPILYTASLWHYLELGNTILKTTIGPKSNAIIVASRTPAGEDSAPVVYNASQEASVVAAHFTEAVPLEGRKGILAELKRNLPQADVFNFVGHSTEMRGQTGLVLWSQPGEEAEIFRPAAGKPNSLRLKLAVLSACSTGKVSEVGLLDANGLVRNFLSSGTTAVVATSWSLDSESAIQYMDLFYGELMHDKGVPYSLWRASLKLRQQQRYLHPYYWAAFASFS